MVAPKDTGDASQALNEALLSGNVEALTAKGADSAVGLFLRLAQRDLGVR